VICLSCKAEIKGNPPLECSGCGLIHESRAPVVGVNHVSQMLAALDDLLEEVATPQEFETVLYAFIDRFEKLEEKWQLREALLSPRLAPSLKEKFGRWFTELDTGLQQGYAALEWMEAIAAGESDNFEEAESCLVGFFRTVCGASAQILDQLDEVSGPQSSGSLFNLPSV
jgi:hypothetical protein